MLRQDNWYQQVVVIAGSLGRRGATLISPILVCAAERGMVASVFSIKRTVLDFIQ